MKGMQVIDGFLIRLYSPFLARSDRHLEPVSILSSNKITEPLMPYLPLSFLRNLKHEHLDSPKGSNKQFWDKLSASKESVNLIARSEAEKLGLQSNASDEEARECKYLYV